jgi:hypothetical protein
LEEVWRKKGEDDTVLPFLLALRGEDSSLKAEADISIPLLSWQYLCETKTTLLFSPGVH